MKKNILLVLILIALMFQIAYANEEENTSLLDNLELNGYLENETAFRINDKREAQKVQNLFQLESSYFIGESYKLYGLLWIQYDAAYDIYANSFSSDAERRYRTNFNFKDMIRELYLEAQYDSLSFKFGRQQVVWGEAVGLRITDIINPQDFREFILDDFIDSRIPLWMLKVNKEFGDISIEGLFIPDFESNILARQGSEWAINSQSPFAILPTDEPKDGLPDSEYGFRVSNYLSGWDISLSYFNSWDDVPSLHKELNPASGSYRIHPKHHRLQNFGATFNNAFDKIVIMGEASYNIGKHFTTTKVSDPDGLLKKNFLYYMLGADYSVTESIHINAQFIQKVISNYDSSLLEDQVQNNFTFLVKFDFLNETLKPELLTIYDANNESFLLRPKAAYDFNDNIKLTLGLDLITGNVGFIGQFDNNDRVYTEIKYSF